MPLINAGDLVTGKTQGYLWRVQRTTRTRAHIRLVHGTGQGEPANWVRWENLAALAPYEGQLPDDVMMVEIERDLDRMIADTLVEPQHRDSAKLLLTAMNAGCVDLERLAALTGLPRKFVDGRAELLRASGIWTPVGKIRFEYPDGPPTHTNIEFCLHVLCAEGVIRCTWAEDTPMYSPPDQRQQKRTELHATLAQLFEWRSKFLPQPLTPEILAESLTVEALAYADIPAAYAKSVTTFRKFRRDDRVRATRRWLGVVGKEERVDEIEPGGSGVKD